MGEDRYDVSARHRYSFFTYFAQFFGVMFGTFGLYYLMEDAKMFPALLPKQYPQEGVKHYTFDTE